MESIGETVINHYKTAIERSHVEFSLGYDDSINTTSDGKINQVLCLLNIFCLSKGEDFI